MTCKKFKIFYVSTVPGSAVILAETKEEALDKFYNWEVEEHTDEELAATIELEEIEEMV